ncbi:uxuA [Symbiodinium sp. CCMP2592]|nr:uxuA [Symbiodinium sp. CCMP2592]
MEAVPNQVKPLLLEETWRWYGPNDPVTLEDVKQSGATGIVTALHQIPIGEIWSESAILERKKMLEDAGFTWSVVESVPVHESIKLGKADRDKYIETYKQTVRNLGKCGIRCICYNFMPVLDWTRTDLTRRWPDGSEALAYDADELAAFDLYILKRAGAEKEYEASALARAKAVFEKMDDQAQQALQQNIIAGLPGRMVEAYSIEEFRSAIAEYENVKPAQMRENLAYFLRSIIPTCEEAGVFMAIHPDDPPRPILGLPPACSTRDDVAALLKAVDSKFNGITLCVGTYASSPQNKVEDMAKEFASRTHFVHLRNVTKEMPPSPETGLGPAGCTFTESDHLGGDVDMYSIMLTMLEEKQRRIREGWGDSANIPFRPDHGHKMLDDMKGKKTNPGYTCIGRLRGLAELRGLQVAIASSGVVKAASETPSAKKARTS